MYKKSKNSLATLLVIVAIFCTIFPLSASAATGTLGTENPGIKASFVNSTGDLVDGNALTAGTYTVNIKLYGMKTVSIFNFVAFYTDDIVVSEVSTISAGNSQFVDGAITNEKLEDGRNKLVVILATDNTDTTAISDGETMVTLTVTVVADNVVDFADCFTVNYDPESTFIEADFGDGFESSYVLVGNEASDITFPLITEDMSPDLTAASYSVAGKITIADNVDGSAGSFGLGGITVSIDGTDISAVTDDNGYYTLTNVPEGTYTLSIAGATTIDRSVSLTVSADKVNENATINVAAVPIVMCDYNKDGAVNSTDISFFAKSIGGNYLYADFNVDGAVNSTDTSAFIKFNNKKIAYTDVAL